MPKPRKSAFEEGYIAIIDALIARRHELGMTQIDLAAAYGEDQSFISRVERRQRRVDHRLATASCAPYGSRRR